MTELEGASEKAIKLLGTLRTYKEGLLLKRQRGLHSTQKKHKFQERFCRLTSASLDYYEPNTRKKRDTPKGEFNVLNIRVVESMPSDTFGKDYFNLYPFQVGDNSEIMYFAAKSLAEREEWLLALRKASRDKKNRMLSHYHKGVFGLTLKGRWGCCGSPQRATPGCSPVPERETPPQTPQPQRSIPTFLEEVAGKRRAGTISDFLLGGGEMGIVSDGGETGKMSGSESPTDSPRVRSFTFIEPVRKPDLKKRDNSKRNTADFDTWGRDSPEPIKELDETGRPKPQQAWSSAPLPVEYNGREENKRASSPSPSEDSGKGTSTGSSRPSSQVIAGETEDGMRTGRSSSFGRCNVLSPLTDQVAPAPSEPLTRGGGGSSRNGHKNNTGTKETDGSAHRPVGRTSSDDREVKGVREKLGETGSSEQRELEDTLKAADQGKRALSSPPGIGCEEEERDTIHPLSSTAEEKEPSSKTATVQLRPKKVPASQSMDKIANKRESYQVPPSPLLAMHKFDFPSTPTHTSSRLSKASTISGSPQLMPRQSIMMQSGLTMDRPDATLGRRRRTIEEYSPLHRACKDGNVAAVWEMLSGSEQADLEEVTFGAIPYTPLFLAFFSDHYQTVQCLLEHGADPSATEPINRAPLLHLASERGCSDMVDLLLAYNAEVNQVDCRGNTALWQACRNGHVDIAEKLIEKGALVNAEGENHRSPLHEATSAGHVSIIELLIKRGADPCSRDSQDATPYDLAYAEGHQEVLQALRELLPDAVRPYSLLHTHTPHRNHMVASLVFTDDETLVSGARDCHATFWDMSEKLSVRQQIRQKDSVLGVERWAEHLVVSSTFVTLNSLEDTNQRRIVADDARQDESLMNPPLHLASFGADGLLATASVEGHVVKVWPPVASQTGLDVQPQARLEVGVSKDTPEAGIIHSLSMSKSAEHPWIAVGLQPGSLFEPHGNKTIHLYDWREGKLHQIFDAGSGGLSVTVHTAFSPCGRQLAVGCYENLCVWEPETGDLLYKFTTMKKIAVTSVCYSPNGAHLAVGLESGEIQVFDIDSNSCIFTLKQHHEYPAAASALAYSENGQLLAVGHRNGQIQIWKAYAGIRDS